MFQIHKGQSMINKTFRMPTDLVQRLTDVAASNGVSVNSLVQQCCEYALANMADKNSQPAAVSANAK